MGVMKEHPRYNVISVRITDEEWESIQSAVHQRSTSVSDLVREAVSVHLQSALPGDIAARAAYSHE